MFDNESVPSPMVFLQMYVFVMCLLGRSSSSCFVEVEVLFEEVLNYLDELRAKDLAPGSD